MVDRLLNSLIFFSYEEKNCIFWLSVFFFKKSNPVQRCLTVSRSVSISKQLCKTQNTVEQPPFFHFFTLPNASAFQVWEKNWEFIIFLLLNYWPSNCIKMACHKSTMLKINWPWPNHQKSKAMKLYLLLRGTSFRI